MSGLCLFQEGTPRSRILTQKLTHLRLGSLLRLPKLSDSYIALDAFTELESMLN